ncbi:hypothetical protein [Pseudovibrio sp. Tun.PSC04-5.I4]|uniref:hypothetical protein n=1 Tax=Pseudovibrio sp. Tun.PSC04-5.I4 TaxID=1798213 RepID=UPI0008925B56|nr:hypothetical protein [Pseudovibrio sp. Tun.PSC04-5.I4]SDQ13334.1 hypothetical protein SAMN04515695_0093 [Pseudovibrio sp. Tun.PSC04-5.I4]
MKAISRLLISLSSLLVISGPALSSEWLTETGSDRNGRDYVNIRVMDADYNLSLSCDAREDSRVFFQLMVASLPHLFAQDGMTANLKLRFSLPGGGEYEDSISVYYFDGGPGDQAWQGTFPASYTTLNVFANALIIELLNPEGTLLFLLPTKGMSLGVDAIRRQCAIGLI